MSVKRILCLVLSVLLLVNFALTVSVSAAEPGISPLWDCTNFVYFALNIYDNTANIDTEIIAYSDTTKIEVSIQMYRKILGIWFKYGDPITHTTSTTRLAVVDEIPNLKNGTYKAKLTATVSSKTASDSFSFESTDST